MKAEDETIIGNKMARQADSERPVGWRRMSGNVVGRSKVTGELTPPTTAPFHSIKLHLITLVGISHLNYEWKNNHTKSNVTKKVEFTINAPWKLAVKYLGACVGLVEDRQSSSDHQAELLQHQTHNTCMNTEDFSHGTNPASVTGSFGKPEQLRFGNRIFSLTEGRDVFWCWRGRRRPKRWQRLISELMTTTEPLGCVRPDRLLIYAVLLEK